MRCLIAAVACAVLLASCSTTRDVVGTTITDTTIVVTPPPVHVELPGLPDSSSASPSWIGQDSSGRIQFTLDMEGMFERWSSDQRAHNDSLLRMALSRARGTFRGDLQPPRVELRYRDTTVYRDREVRRGPTFIEKIGWAGLGALALLVLAGVAFAAVKFFGR